MKYNKVYAILFLLFIAASFTNCASTLDQDVRFSFLTKEQPGRPAIKDVFFNETNSKYMKYRIQPDEKLKEDEAPIFDEKKLPKNNFPAEDDWMQALLEALEEEDFFNYSRSAKSWEFVEQFFNTNANYKQCLILEVDDNVSVAFPPDSVIELGDAQRKKYLAEMSKFEKYVTMFVATSNIYRTSEAIVGGGIEEFRESEERNRENTERDLNSRTGNSDNSGN